MAIFSGRSLILINKPLKSQKERL